MSDKPWIIGQNDQSIPGQQAQIQLQLPSVQMNPGTASMIRQNLPQIIVGLQQLNQIQYTLAVFGELLVMFGATEEKSQEAAVIVNLRMAAQQAQEQSSQTAAGIVRQNSREAK